MFRSLFIVLLAAAAAPAHADVRHGKMFNRELIRRYEAKRPDIEGRMKDAPAACSAIIASDPDEAALLRRLAMLGQCLTAISPPAEAGSPSQERTIAGPSIVMGRGACSVVGEVGRSC